MQNQTTGKQSYVKPEVVAYGSIEDLVLSDHIGNGRYTDIDTNSHSYMNDPGCSH